MITAKISIVKRKSTQPAAHVCRASCLHLLNPSAKNYPISHKYIWSVTGTFTSANASADTSAANWCHLDPPTDASNVSSRRHCSVFSPSSSSWSETAVGKTQRDQCCCQRRSCQTTSRRPTRKVRLLAPSASLRRNLTPAGAHFAAGCITNRPAAAERASERAAADVFRVTYVRAAVRPFVGENANNGLWAMGWLELKSWGISSVGRAFYVWITLLNSPHGTGKI